MINARDASPLCAGLLFGAPAGIIAGVIGGVERWLAAYRGAGRIHAPCLQCFRLRLAGVFAAVLRKQMFDSKKLEAASTALTTAAIYRSLYRRRRPSSRTRSDAKTAVFVRSCLLAAHDSGKQPCGDACGASPDGSVRSGTHENVRHERNSVSQSFQRFLLICVMAGP